MTLAKAERAEHAALGLDGTTTAYERTLRAIDRIVKASDTAATRGCSSRALTTAAAPANAVPANPAPANEAPANVAPANG